jgi:hypothetical protein
MSFLPEPPDPGQIVRLRQRLYLVEEVVDPPEPGQATLVRLSCLDDDAQGQPLEVLWESEVDAEILTGESWERLAERGFDPTPLFSAYLHALRWNCVTATDPKLFQSPFRAGIKLDAYQLEPLRKALLLPRVNLFIADDVGLGKTIEAGLIARELLLRRRVREITVICPPSMLYQWQDELENRFGLSFVILDREYVGRVRRERGYGVNPWTTHPRVLLSQSLLIDEAHAGPLRDWLGEFRGGSLLILDEAHHAAPASGARYAIDSRITRAVRDLAPRFEHRLFLSATPHNGHSNSFSALLEILDPQRFCRGVPVKGAHQLEPVMVRRLKEDLRAIQGSGFSRREVVQVDIDGERGRLDFAVRAMESRAAEHDARNDAGRKEELQRRVHDRVSDLLDSWERIAHDQRKVGASLQYQHELPQGMPLLRYPLDPELPNLTAAQRKFRAARSMRDVEAEVNLWMRVLGATDDGDAVGTGGDGAVRDGDAPDAAAAASSDVADERDRP